MSEKESFVKLEIKIPAAEDEFQAIEDTLEEYEDQDDGIIVVDLEDHPSDISYIQACKVGDFFRVEAAVEVTTGHTEMYALREVSLADAIDAFKAICVDGKDLTAGSWENVTKEVFPIHCISINIFKRAFKVVRNNSDSIYKGFGFKHLSDATQYYVHPDNQSLSGKTTLCQPIGEAIILFSTMLNSIINDDPIGDYYISENAEKAYFDLFVPDDYRENGVVDNAVFRYRATFENDRLVVAAYDCEQRFIDGNMEHLRPLYKLLPAFCVVLAKTMDEEPDFKALMERFIENPVVDEFVNLHEDFYQLHKMDEYSFAYADIPGIDTENWKSFSSSYEVIKENRKEMNEKKEVVLSSFSPALFDEEQLSMIPALSEEFILPENLKSLCNAVVNGDTRAVLFHGPAGTGKTISCKLIAQTTGLPIMETINCTENLDEYVLGKYIPEGDRIIFKESYVTKAIRDGGAVVFEEINFAKPQYLAFLNSLLDDNGFVRLDNGTVVKRNPNFRFFATMNLGYYGTKELNQALFNRFNAVVELAALSDESIKLMLTTRIPECAPVVDKILGVYHKLKKKIEAEELDVVISPRNLENWARLAKYEGYIAAAEKTIVPIAKSDRVLENTIRGILMLYKWK